jgi:hypothetical protein
MRQTALFGLPEHIVPYSLIAFGYPVDKNRHLLPKLPLLPDFGKRLYSGAAKVPS